MLLQIVNTIVLFQLNTHLKNIVDVVAYKSKCDIFRQILKTHTNHNPRETTIQS